MDKKGVRLYIKSLCLENAGTLEEKSRLICRRIIESQQYQEADQVFAYMALRDEVDLLGVIRQALLDEKRVALPKILDPDEGRMEFFYVDPCKPLDEQTLSGVYGILEPDTSRPAALDDTSSKILILVPGRAFTLDGDRLGRGKGYYDRFLAKKRLLNVTVAGVCFDFQVLPELPTDPTDIKMDVILRG